MDRVVRTAARSLGAKIDVFAVVADDALWFKARHGIDRAHAPREHSFCDATIEADGAHKVPDVEKQPEFQYWDLVQKAPHIKSYLGLPIRDSQDEVVGTLCVMHDAPKRWGKEAEAILEDLALELEDHLAAREWALQLHEALSDVPTTKMEVLNDIAHDLGTPLTPLRLQVAALRSVTNSNIDWKALDRIEANLVKLESILSVETKRILDDASKRPRAAQRARLERPARRNPWTEGGLGEEASVAVKRPKKDLL